MTEFKSCVSFTHDGRARENLLALYAKERKSNIEFNPREYARVSYVISRAFFSTHRIRDLFHMASLGIQSSSPFDLYLQPTTGLLWLEAIFFQVLTSDPLRLQNENSFKKYV